MATLAKFEARNRAMFTRSFWELGKRAKFFFLHLLTLCTAKMSHVQQKKLLLKVWRSWCTRVCTKILLAKWVRAGLHTPIACTFLLPRGRNGTLSGRTRAIIEQRRADVRTRSCHNSRRCVQRYARGFARLCYLHDFLPYKRATLAIVQQLIARCWICEVCYEVIDSERELRFGRETSVYF